MAVGATLAAAALVAAAPAMAAPHSFSSSLSASGSVRVSWHGDPARGCTAAGLCGYRGALTARPGSGGEFDVEANGNRVLAAYGDLGVGDPPVVRVQREDDGACVDLSSSSDLTVFARPIGSGRVRVRLDLYGIDRGHCAGPDLAGLLERLPSRTISLARLRRGGYTIPFSVRKSYGSGRFSGTLSSTLRLRVGRVRPQSSDFGEGREPSPGGALRVANVTAVYRVTGLTGKFATAFHGLAAPLCDAFDACGAVGSTSWAILSASGRVVVDATARARPGDRGLSGALAALRRGHGRVSTYGTIRHGLGETSATVSRPGALTCRDSHSALAPGFAFSFDRRRIFLAFGGEEASLEAGDLVRTGCPGPPTSGVLGRGSLAIASLPVTAVQRRRLSLTLRGAGRIHDPAYAGTHRARFGLALRRVALRVSYDRESR